MSYPVPSTSQSVTAGERQPLLCGKDDSGLHQEVKRGSCQWIQARHVLAIVAFFGFFNVYCMRVNLSVALVAMSNSSSGDVDNTTSESVCMTPFNNSESSSDTGEFDWDQQTQGLILGAFFYGYLTTQLPGGYMAERYGGKRLLGLGILCTAVLTLLTPLAARWNLPALITLRVLMGIGEGVTYPAMHAMWGNWAPVWERTKLAGFTYAGSQLGTVISMPISGILCGSDFLGGWPSVFYIFGGISCVWVVVWMCLVHETPADHPRISKAEREYIEASIGKREHLVTPWKEIFTSGALWAIAVASVANNFGSYTFLTCLPTFLQKILKFDIKSDGFLSALPFAAVFVMQIVAGITADFVRTRRYLSTLNTRRLFTGVGMLLPALALVGVSFVGCDHVWAVTLLTLALGASGITTGGFAMNQLDIAPKFAGVLLGITNGLATIPGFLAPLIVNQLTGQQETIFNWRKVFFLTAGINTLGALVYIILGKGEEMPWARGKTRTQSDLTGHPVDIQTGNVSQATPHLKT